jgi:hypothetical protein
LNRLVPVRIDVPDHLMNTIGFLKVMVKIHEEYRKRPEPIAIHESAHVVYYMRAGFTQDQIIVRGPTIKYDPACNCFKGSGAEVSLHASATIKLDKESFSNVAKACAAGGAASRVISKQFLPGEDDQDFNRFADWCEKLYSEGRITQRFDVQDIWRQAQAAVEQELLTYPEIETSIRNKMPWVMDRIYEEGKHANE